MTFVVASTYRCKMSMAYVMIFASFLVVMPFLALMPAEAGSCSVYPEGDDGDYRCCDGCTAKDIKVEGFDLKQIEQCNSTTGNATSNLSVTILFDRVNTYCVFVVFDVYADGVLIIDDYKADLGNFTNVKKDNETKNLFISEIQWPCGSSLVVEGLYLSYSGNDNCAFDCIGTESSKCYTGEPIDVLIPGIRIRKNVSGPCAGTEFLFDIYNTTSQEIYNDSHTFTCAGGNYTFTNLSVGYYDVIEKVPDCWKLEGISYNTSLPPPNTTSYSPLTNGTRILLHDEEMVTATFTDIKKGRIIVDKNTDPSGDPKIFNFTGSWGGVTDFSLNDTANPYEICLVPAMTYTVNETVPSGWNLSNVSCSSLYGNSTCTAISNGTSIALAMGDVVTVTFNDTKEGRIIVDKNTTPSGDPRTFWFSGSWGGGTSFSLTDTAQPYNSGYLIPGMNYSVNETVPQNWTLCSVDCYSELGTSSCSGILNGTNVTLAAGDNVTVTFRDCRCQTADAGNDTIVCTGAAALLQGNATGYYELYWNVTEGCNGILVYPYGGSGFNATYTPLSGEESQCNLTFLATGPCENVTDNATVYVVQTPIANVRVIEPSRYAS